MVRDILREQAGDEPRSRSWIWYRRARRPAGPTARADARRRASSARRGGACPPRNTLDRGTALLPDLLAARICPSSGIDHAILYPTYGLGAGRAGRTPTSGVPFARAFNTFYAEAFADHRDALTPVGIIPMHTPEEAIAELELRDRRARAQGVHVRRPDQPARAGRRPAARARPAGSTRSASTRSYDYDPVWATLRRARRVADVPHRGDGLDDPHARRRNYVLQPHRHVRDRGRDAGAVAVPRRRAAPVPARCASRSRKVASRGRRRCRGPGRALGEAQPRRRRALRPGDARPRAAGRARSSGTAASAYRDRLDQLDDGLRPAQPSRRGPGDARRVRGVGHHRRRGHPRRLHRAVTTSAARPTIR